MTILLNEETFAEPLSPEELAWATKLDKLLGQMPPRIKLIEIDDRLKIVDKALAECAGLSGGGYGQIVKAGAELADLTNGMFQISGMTF
ncbi:patatin [Novimethylophilus kurashikiensis]|uniref:Patatin n=1 Tax=Novimethylophilus kurashikiensis TaxID=1825523 RepID=A0A2R5F9U3_9PROT|nr:hypothetical protein [Novimethylophilus kurashikiensis]GBG14805.1 patatin [Novimethylophilus kurashikiensis]